MFPRPTRPSRGRLLTAAYYTAVGSCLLATALTYVYVGAGARELNPVLAAGIDRFGLWAALLARTVVVVACYWAYALFVARGFRGAVAFAWSGAAIHLLDATHDLRVAVAAGPMGDPGAGLALLLVCSACVGLVGRPPWLGDGVDDR